MTMEQGWDEANEHHDAFPQLIDVTAVEEVKRIALAAIKASRGVSDGGDVTITPHPTDEGALVLRLTNQGNFLPAVEALMDADYSCDPIPDAWGNDSGDVRVEYVGEQDEGPDEARQRAEAERDDLAAELGEDHQGCAITPGRYIFRVDTWNGTLQLRCGDCKPEPPAEGGSVLIDSELYGIAQASTLTRFTTSAQQHERQHHDDE